MLLFTIVYSYVGDRFLRNCGNTACVNVGSVDLEVSSKIVSGREDCFTHQFVVEDSRYFLVAERGSGVDLDKLQSLPSI